MIAAIWKVYVMRKGDPKRQPLAAFVEANDAGNYAYEKSRGMYKEPDCRVIVVNKFSNRIKASFSQGERKK